MRTFLWFLTLSITAAECLLSQPAFVRQDIPVGVAPAFAVAGDFNGDGRTDLAVSMSDPTVYVGWEFAVLLNEGGLRFGNPIRSGKHQATSAWAADFNGDGKDDLLTGDSYLHLSQGDGTFLPPLPVGDDRLFPTLCIGDLNHDGKSDVVARADGYGIRVWQGNGDGTFQAGATFPVQSAFWAAIADFDDDGRNDLVTFGGSPTEQGFHVFLGRGDGTFAPQILTTPAIRDPMSPAWPPGGALVADFNGDQLPDIASWAGILLGQGDGTFQAPLPYPGFDIADAFPRAIAAADFTGDGRADLVVDYVRENLISIFPGTAAGTLSAPAHEPVGWGHTTWIYWTPADLNADDQLDIVNVNSYSGTVSVLLADSQGAPALPRAFSTASDTAIVAPGSLATLLAPTGAAGSGSSSTPWPTELGGIRLEVRDSAGVARLAALVFVSSGQVNFQVPGETALGEATLWVVNDGEPREVGSMQVDAVAPAVFMVSPWNAVPAATAMLVETDDSQIPLPVYRCFPSPTATSCESSAIPLAAAGDRPVYLTFYGTGFRDANLDNVTCSIDTVLAQVVYAGPQGSMPGVDQINVRVPREVLDGAFLGGSTVVIRIDGVASNVAFLRWEEWVD